MSDETTVVATDSTPSIRKPRWAFTSEPVIAGIVTVLGAGLIVLMMHHYLRVHNVWDIIVSVLVLLVIASGVATIIYYARNSRRATSRDA